jgi:hypothetical protein
MLYEFVKTLDPTSAVREGEAKLALSTNPFVLQLWDKTKALFQTKNKLFGAEARADMFRAIDTLREGAETAIRPEMKRIAGIAIDSGVPLERVLTGPYQKILSGESSATAGVPPPAGVPKTLTPEDGPHKGKTLRWVGPGPRQYEVVR